MKKLIVVDGVDSSGKQTQVENAYNMLKEMGINVTKVSFPDYESPSSSLVKMYLAGDFGSNPEDVSAYAASSMYALDRYASFKSGWGKDFYEGEGVILCDRYVTSNMIHQASKIKDKTEKAKFLEWLYDMEYSKLELPQPDLILFLDMPVWAAQKLMAKRKNKITGDAEKDIHEKNTSYLEESYNNAIGVANTYGWSIVRCTEGEVIKTREEISEEIAKKIKEIL